MPVISGDNAFHSQGIIDKGPGVRISRDRVGGGS